MRALLVSLSIAALAVVPVIGQAKVIYTQPATALTTDANGGGGCCDGTGIWFNPLTSYSESRGYFFPNPLYEDGKFFLLTDTSSGSAEARIYTQGFFSRGNGVVYTSASDLNPARFDLGESIGAGTGYQSPGAGYTDLGPSFGNWSLGRGFLGLTIRDPSGSSSSDVFYGFADITINSDYSISLNGFAYENVRGNAITTAFATPVPEPSTWLLLAAGVAGLSAMARRRRLRAG